MPLAELFEVACAVVLKHPDGLVGAGDGYEVAAVGGGVEALDERPLVGRAVVRVVLFGLRLGIGNGFPATLDLSPLRWRSFGCW